jgi:hypothetical protein
VLERLSIFLGLDQESLWTLLHADRSNDIGSDRRRISPMSLSTESYDRSIWGVNEIPYCSQSMELLNDRCSECQARLSWRTTLPIMLFQNCWVHLRRFRTRQVPEKFRGLARIVADLLSHRQADQRAALSAFPEEIRSMKPPDVFTVGLQFGRLISLGYPNRTLVRDNFWEIGFEPNSLDVAQFLSGFRVLMSWPTKVRDLLSPKAGRLTIADRCTFAANLRTYCDGDGLPFEFRQCVSAELLSMNRRRSGLELVESGK